MVDAEKMMRDRLRKHLLAMRIAEENGLELNGQDAMTAMNSMLVSLLDRMDPENEFEFGDQVEAFLAFTIAHQIVHDAVQEKGADAFKLFNLAKYVPKEENETEDENAEADEVWTRR